MAWAPDYASLAELKHALAPGITDTADDAELTLALSAASRAIDSYCGRQFGQTAGAVPRYYQSTSAGTAAVVIDDLMDLTGLVVKTGDGGGTFPTTLTLNSQVRLFPWNAVADGRPYTMIVGFGGTRWTRGERTVEVTARWGWSAVPAVVKQAALLQAARIFRRKDAPFGILGSPEIGSEIRLLSALDPDVAVLLGGLRRRWAAVTV